MHILFPVIRGPGMGVGCMGADYQQISLQRVFIFAILVLLHKICTVPSTPLMPVGRSSLYPRPQMILFWVDLLIFHAP